MGAILKLSLVERVCLDPDRLVELCVGMGEPAAEALVTASIDDVATCMERLPMNDLATDQPTVLAVVRRLSGVAEHIGLTSYVRVADDVRRCPDCGDLAAYGATLARLQRVASKAQTALWDLQDMTI